MIRFRKSFGVAFIAAILASTAALAHPDHKIMGTVTMAASDHVMIKTKDDKVHTVKVVKTTAVTRNKKPMKAADIPVGARVVATTVSDEDLTAKKIEVGVVPTSAGAGRELAPVPVGTSGRIVQDDAAAIATWLDGYDKAFLAKDLDALAMYYHPDVTIYEGGGINNGWADYRDHHLGPELKAFEGLEFGHTDRKVHLLGDGRTAYVTSLYFIKAKMGERMLDSGGLETLVLIKQPDGNWKIRHSHTSARARRPAGAAL